MIYYLFDPWIILVGTVLIYQKFLPWICTKRNCFIRNLWPKQNGSRKKLPRFKKTINKQVENRSVLANTVTKSSRTSQTCKIRHLKVLFNSDWIHYYMFTSVNIFKVSRSTINTWTYVSVSEIMSLSLISCGWYILLETRFCYQNIF